MKPTKLTFKIVSALIVFITLNFTLTTNAEAGVSSSVKSQIRKLFYDSSQAFGVSTQNGINFIKSHNYPGVVQMSSPLWKKWESDLVSINWKLNEVPDLNTIDKDPSWKWGAGNCHPAMKAPPKGDTYIVSLNITSSSDYEAATNGRSDVHVTIYKGKAYYYYTICFKNE